MTILSAHHSSRIRNRAMGILHLIAADESCEVSDILALITETVVPVSTPSQPTSTPAVQARPVDPSSRSLDGLPTSLPGADGAVDRAPHPQSAVDADLEEQERAIETGKSGEASAAPAPTLRDRIEATHREHPEWPPKLLAEHCGTREEQVRNAARKRNLNLPTWWDYQRSLKAATTEALKTAPAKPQEPVERAGPPTPRSEAPSSPAATAVPQRPSVEADASDVLHRVKKAPSGRFYLRDKTTLEFVHQSLAPSPQGSGPMMTKDRKWAWYDTMQRYRGAKKRWPELADMRKEAVAK